MNVTEKSGAGIGGNIAYDRSMLTAWLEREILSHRVPTTEKRYMLEGTGEVFGVLDALNGETLQDRWASFEHEVWPRWVKGERRSPRWNFGVRTLVVTRLVRPGWPLLTQVRATQWFDHLAEDDPFVAELSRLRAAVAKVDWVVERAHVEAYGWA
jgi:hypothetical protein